MAWRIDWQRGRRDGSAVAAGSSAPGGLETDPGRLVGHHRRQGSVGIDGADAGGPPGQARDALVEPSTGSSTTHTGRSVACRPDSSERAPKPARSITSRAARSATRSLRYWPSRVPASPQSSRPSRLSATARDHLVEDLAGPERVKPTDRASWTAPWSATVPDPGRGRGRVGLDRVAVIDVAGYVAELKDHAVDHGFHVHDERHFVETYSLRQAWEVDLHPEEGCNGPLDLHLALEVDPRVLLAFEDVVVDLPDGEDPRTSTTSR